MRIAIDGTSPLDGAGLVWLEQMVGELAALERELEIVVFVRSDMRASVSEARGHVRRRVVRFPRFLRVASRLAWQQVVLPATLSRMKIDALISPYDVAPLFSPCPVILGIQNASPYLGPDSTTPLSRLRLRVLKWVTAFSSRRASRVFFVSEWSRREIARVLRLPLEKTRVVPNGVSAAFVPRAAGSAETGKARYVLCVGSIGAHKDYVTLIEGFAECAARKPPGPGLRFVGPIIDASMLESMRARMRSLGLEDQVSILGSMPAAELVGQYQSAAVLVMASHVETFGLPMIEAMACHISILASDIPVAREICGDAALYYRPGDSSDLAEKLWRVLEDIPTRTVLIQRAADRARAFPWSSSAARLLAITKEATAARLDRP